METLFNFQMFFLVPVLHSWKREERSSEAGIHQPHRMRVCQKGFHSGSKRKASISCPAYKSCPGTQTYGIPPQRTQNFTSSKGLPMSNTIHPKIFVPQMFLRLHRNEQGLLPQEKGEGILLLRRQKVSDN